MENVEIGMLGILVDSREEINIRASITCPQKWMSCLHIVGCEAVLKKEMENENGSLNILIAETFQACRANYLFGLAVCVETSWGRRRFVCTHNVVARHVNGYLHSVSINIMHAKTGGEDGKAHPGKTCSGISWLMQVALLRFLLWVKLLATHTCAPHISHICPLKAASGFFCLSRAQFGGGVCCPGKLLPPLVILMQL